MRVLIHKNKNWLPIGGEELRAYWETTDISEIEKCFRYLGKKIVYKNGFNFKLDRKQND